MRIFTSNRFNACLVLLLTSIALIVLATAAKAQYAGDQYGGGSYEPPKGSGQPSAFDGISYDFLDIGYRYLVFGGDKSYLENGNGLEANLTLDLLWLFFIEADFLYSSADAKITDPGEFFDLSSSGNFTKFELGVGGHLPVGGDRFHLVASVGFLYENQDIDDDIFKDLNAIVDGAGFYIRPGFRAMITEWLELDGWAEYEKLGDGGQSTWGAKGQLLFHITDFLGISGQAEYTDNLQTYGVGLRLSW